MWQLGQDGLYGLVHFLNLRLIVDLVLKHLVEVLLIPFIQLLSLVEEPLVVSCT